MRFRVRAVSALIALLVVWAGAPASAQEQSAASSISVSPGIISNTLDAGKTFTTVINVANAGTQTSTIHAMVSAFTPSQQVDPAFQSAYDTSDWYRIAQPDFILSGGQKVEVPVEVNVPANAEPGGHYATIYFEATSLAGGVQSSGASINPRVGVLSLLVVNGAINQHVVAQGPIDTQTLQLESGATKFQIGLKNDGNVHVLPTGNIVVKNIFGQKVKTIPLPTGIVLPGTTRTYDAQWQHGLRFGIYKAEAQLTVGSQQTPLPVKPARFVLFPLVVAIPVVLVVASAILIALRYRKNRRLRRRVPDTEVLDKNEGSSN